MALKKQKTYKDVYEIATETFLRSDITSQLEKAGLHYETEQNRLIVSISLLQRTNHLDRTGPDIQGRQRDNITLATKIIILHYINTTSGNEPGNNLVAYEDIPGCRHYQPVFEKRVTKPLSFAFGQDKYALLEAGLALNGKKEKYGDVSVTIPVLPMVPVTFILWEGDEEFVPIVRVFFDPLITSYLPLEDIFVISKLASTRILKVARKQHMYEEYSN